MLSNLCVCLTFLLLNDGLFVMFVVVVTCLFVCFLKRKRKRMELGGWGSRKDLIGIAEGKTTAEYIV